MRLLLLITFWAAVAAAAVAPDRWIVELEGEPVAAHVVRTAGRGRARAALAGAAARSHRARLRSAQSRLRREVEAEGAGVVAQVDTVANALLVRAGAAQAARLSGLPGVVRVFPARRFRLMLDHALPLHHVPEAWARAGAAGAGAGIKIGIIDSGIDVGHPGFQDPSMSAPEGFPRYSSASDAAYTNGKVIVARSYARMFDAPEPDPSANDSSGHGTAAAMAAAGAPNGGPLASITGVAPKAWLGSYKVFGTPGVNDSPADDVLIKALDDAVADGMDIINLSLGSPVTPAVQDDPLALAVERAAELGVVVVISAGNTGPDVRTIASPGTAPSAVSVGASLNDRFFSANISIRGGPQYLAIAGTGPKPAAPLTGPVKDVAALDGTGLAYAALPAGSLTGHLALILRGTCYFEQKLLNAQAAGAKGAIVYSSGEQPDAIGMDAGTATLPAEMISHQDGTALRQALSGTVEATMYFTPAPVWVDPHALADFSARGPSVDNDIKPDLVASGTHIYTAALRSARADIYSPDGYADVAGTSFSAPLVAGAAALLEAARPGLAASAYRSLLVNSAAQAYLQPDQPARVQQAGAGTLDVGAALRSTLAAYPVSLSFGGGTANGPVVRRLVLTNVGTAAETYLLSAIPRDGAPVPSLPVSSLSLDAGQSVWLDLEFPAAGLAPGQYEGVVAVQGTASGVESRIPYWYAAGPGPPAAVTVLYSVSSPSAGATLAEAILFRVTDSAGLALTAIDPKVTVVSGGGAVNRVRLAGLYPGVFFANVTFGPVAGANVFRIEAGGVSKEIRITTTR